MILGADGCRYGWIAIFYDGKEYTYGIFKTFEEMIRVNRELERVLIDVPIGLGRKESPRTLDAYIRRFLGKRSSTVFNAPCKLAVYENDKEKAKELNIEEEGKSLSLQSLNIRDKIREVDRFVCFFHDEIEVYESHPELSFKHLNDDNVVMTKKSTYEGQQERLKIIGKYDRELVDCYYKARKAFKKKDVKNDDIIDAICLCLVNKLGQRDKLSFYFDENLINKDGIEMKVAYYKPEE